MDRLFLRSTIFSTVWFLQEEFEKLILSYPKDSDLHDYCFKDFLALSEPNLAEFTARATFKHKGSFARLHLEGSY